MALLGEVIVEAALMDARADCTDVDNGGAGDGFPHGGDEPLRDVFGVSEEDVQVLHTGAPSFLFYGRIHKLPETALQPGLKKLPAVHHVNPGGVGARGKSHHFEGETLEGGQE